MIGSLVSIFLFPGLMFLVVAGLAGQFIDRKIYARLQNRIGPPWYQPAADFIKLAAKEDIVPDEANPGMFKAMPIFALTAITTSILYIPLWKDTALYTFKGDLVVVLYLLTIPTLTFFLGGWYSTSLYSKIGAVRALTQLFAYEVPLLMSILAPGLLANTWSLSGISQFYAAHPWYWLVNIPGFAISMVTLLGKLEKVPFDIPEAETEIVAGTFTEYSGRLMAMFKLAIDMEAIAAASLLAAVYLPFGLSFNPVVGFVIYLLKILFIITAMSLLRTLFARLRIDQMMSFCWRYLAPLAFVQIVLNLTLKGFILR